MSKMIIKKHVSPENKLVLAVCDSNLLGKRFEQGQLQLDLTSSFYQGEEADENKVKGLMKEAFIINLVGKESITLAEEQGLVEKGNVLEVDSVPHAQVVLVSENIS